MPTKAHIRKKRSGNSKNKERERRRGPRHTRCDSQICTTELNPSLVCAGAQQRLSGFLFSPSSMSRHNFRKCITAPPSASHLSHNSALRKLAKRSTSGPNCLCLMRCQGLAQSACSCMAVVFNRNSFASHRLTESQHEKLPSALLKSTLWCSTCQRLGLTEKTQPLIFTEGIRPDVLQIQQPSTDEQQCQKSTCQRAGLNLCKIQYSHKVCCAWETLAPSPLQTNGVLSLGQYIKTRAESKEP